MPSASPDRPSTAQNAFTPEDWEGMPVSRRRAYLCHLLGVREKIEGLLHASADGEALRSVLTEVEAALAVLGEEKPAAEAAEAGEA